MHLLLALTGLLIAVLVGYLALVVLRRVDGWSRRRDLQLLVLTAPLISAGLGVVGLLHFADRDCFRAAPRWDAGLFAGLVGGLGLVVLGSVGLGLVRLALMGRLVARRGMPADAEVQALADALAQRLGTSPVRVLACAYGRPLALTCGFVRPSILMSTWMVEHLDRAELESVLAHELGHVARGDYRTVWLATILRDAFFYLPTSHAAYRQLQQDKELACDDLSVRGTSRPLALASALAKVWHSLVDGPILMAGQPLTGTAGSIEERIERLLTAPETAGLGAVWSTTDSGARVRAWSGMIALLTVKAPAVLLILAAMGCGPIAAARGLP